jgi:hypothetical protein
VWGTERAPLPGYLMVQQMMERGAREGWGRLGTPLCLRWRRRCHGMEAAFRLLPPMGGDSRRRTGRVVWRKPPIQQCELLLEVQICVQATRQTDDTRPGGSRGWRSGKCLGQGTPLTVKQATAQPGSRCEGLDTPVRRSLFGGPQGA